MLGDTALGWGSLSAEKKAHWRGHRIVCAGLLWKPCVGCGTGEVELLDKNSGASWNEVMGPMRNAERTVRVRDGLPQGYMPAHVRLFSDELETATKDGSEGPVLGRWCI
jgi:hypothetical protein